MPMAHYSPFVGRCPSPAAGGGARRLETKRAGAALSHIDVAGAFEGYASLFGVADLSRDVVVLGAFRDSLARRGPRGIKMLWQHDPGLPIGTWDDVVEDRRGLFVRGRLDLAVAKARDVHALMKSGAVDGLSIGFRAERAREDAATGLRRLEKIDLWEISLVTFPMLPQARVSAVKTAGGPGDPVAARRLIRAIRRACAALRSPSRNTP